MTSLNLKIIETAIVVFLFIVIRVILRKMITRAGVKYNYQRSRIKISKKIASTLLFVVGLTSLLMIWGVDQSELLFFISSALTVMGIALFAQWSILSNITSGLIIYLNHSVKIGDTISIIDRDFEVEGRVSAIGIFFLTLKTEEDDEITIPCNIFLQKMIRKKNLHKSAGNSWTI